MKTTNKKILTLILVVCCLVAILSLAACVKKPEPDPDIPVPQDKTLTAEEVISAIDSIAIIDDDISIVSEGMEYAVYNNNGYPFARIVNGNNETHIGLVGSTGRAVIVDRSDNTSTAYDLNDAEYDRTVSEIRSMIVEQIQSFKDIHTLSENAKEIMGDEYVTEYTGTTTGADGVTTVNVKSKVLIYSGLFDCDATYVIDNQKRLTKVSIKYTQTEGYTPSNFDKQEIIGSIDITYGDVVSLPSASTDNYDGDVVLRVQNDAKMPDSFVNSAAAGSEVTLPAPTNNEKTFIGWYYDEDLKYPVTENKLKVTYTGSSMDIYPKWNLPVPEMRLDGGKLSDADAEKVKTIYILSGFVNIRPEKSGYEFEGWYTDAGFSQKVQYNSDICIEADTVLYAKFEKLVEVKFFTNSDYAMVPEYGVAGSSFYAGEAVKKGSKFIGWYTDPALTIPAGNVFPAENTTYYAKYEQGINVNLHIYDGFKYYEVPKYITVATDGTLDDLLSKLDVYYDYVRMNNNMEFDYWGTNVSGGVLTTYPTNEITVYAIYAQPIFINYQADSTLNMEKADAVQYLKRYHSSYNDYLNYLASTIELPDGKEFEGWYSDSARTTLIANNAEWPTSTVSIYGNIVDLKRFTLHLNGGEYRPIDDDLIYQNMISSYGTIKQAFMNMSILPYEDGGVHVDITAPQGKYFAGWYTDSGLETRFTDYDNIPSRSLNLYAKYEDIVTISLVRGTSFEEYNWDLSWNGNSNEVTIMSYYNMLNSSNDINNYSDYIGRLRYNLGFNDLEHDGVRYVFEDFYTDADCTELYVPGDVFENRTLYVNFKTVN